MLAANRVVVLLRGAREGPFARSLSVLSTRYQKANDSPAQTAEDKLPPRPEVGEALSLTDIGTRRLFSAEHDIFRQTTRKFFTNEVAPQYPKWEKQGQVDREIWERAGELGLLGIATPSEYGGHGGDILTASILWEEQWLCNCTSPVLSLQSDLIIPYMWHYGSKEQIAKYVPPMVAGKMIGAIAMTEPGAGSDLQSMRTYARKDGDDFVLNGSKVFITHGYTADVVIVAAITNKEAKTTAHGISLLLVEDGMPGFKKGRKLNKIGCLAEDTAELFFEDVRVPKSHLLGEENKGFYYLMEQMPQERIVIAGRAKAHCEWMFEETRQYLKNREAFGKTLMDIKTIQHKMAELKTAICASSAFYDQCLQIHNERGLDLNLSSMLKYWTTDLQKRVADECVQLHGGYGYMKDTPIARAYLDARIQSIWGGTNEIMKELIARNIAC